MEYFNTYTTEYLNAIDSKSNRYKIKMELLTYFETAIGDITKDVSSEADGQINVNYQQLTRRSCSLSMINVDQKYIPSPDNIFWHNRKFRLWLGVVARSGNVYWWSQGVFFTQSATSDGHTVNVEGVDKGGALDGTLGINLVGVQHIIPTGTPIDKLIKDTLMLNLYNDMGALIEENNGGNFPVDPVVPIVDHRYRNIATQSELSIDTNNYIGTIFEYLANGYGADIYYDINGHFQFAELTNGQRIDGYRYMAHQWEYNLQKTFYEGANYQYNFEGKNAVKVYTNASGLENVSYTAYNTNPSSPLRVPLVGVRQLEDVEMPYVDISQSEMVNKCKNYAEYLLILESMKGMNVTFESAVIPHLDVNRTIGVTDKFQKLDNETFIIQSISIPLSAGKMSITATSINWLPNNLSVG